MTLKMMRKIFEGFEISCNDYDYIVKKIVMVCNGENFSREYNI